MSYRTIDGFFYGLYMDPVVLEAMNVKPRSPRRAYVDNFELLIGQKATLSPKEGKRSYGMVYSLTHNEVNTLYSGPGMEVYYPEAVAAVTIDNTITTACLCFNLLEPPHADETNREYASKLQVALKKMEFPVHYIEALNSI